MKNKNYYDEWADVYDLVYGSYRDDINFYIKEAKKAKGKVLEIACGSGRVYLELLKDGIDAYGIDISRNMLNVLKKKAKKLMLKSKVYNADMKTFRLGHKFSSIIIPFRAFLHNLTINDQVTTLNNLRRHLLPNGKLILNFFYPNPRIISKYGRLLKRTIKIKKEKFVLKQKTYFLDEPNQIIEGSSILIKSNKVFWNGKIRLAFIYKREFELLLKLAGFTKWKVYGDFEYHPLKSFRQEMIWIAQLN